MLPECVLHQGEKLTDVLQVPRLRVRKDWYVGLHDDPVDHSHPDVGGNTGANNPYEKAVHGGGGAGSTATGGKRSSSPHAAIRVMNVSQGPAAGTKEPAAAAAGKSPAGVGQQPQQQPQQQHQQAPGGSVPPAGQPKVQQQQQQQPPPQAAQQQQGQTQQTQQQQQQQQPSASSPAPALTPEAKEGAAKFRQKLKDYAAQFGQVGHLVLGPDLEKGGG